MTRAPARRRLMAGLLAAATALPVAYSAAQAQDGTALDTYRNERHGYALSYPAAQFVALPSATEDGRQFISKDGSARLLVGTLPNFDNKSLRAYRDFTLSASYPGAKVDYAPVRDTWFVLSGIHLGMVFYQRVNFTCGGRAINSWAMVYPEAQKAVYDPVVELIHRNYRPGGGNCSQRMTSAAPGTR
jgi:hypothetical protein